MSNPSSDVDGRWGGVRRDRTDFVGSTEDWILWRLFFSLFLCKVWLWIMMVADSKCGIMASPVTNENRTDRNRSNDL